MLHSRCYFRSPFCVQYVYGVLSQTVDRGDQMTEQHEIDAIRSKLKTVMSELQSFDYTEAADAFEGIEHMIPDSENKRDAFMRGCVWTLEKIIEKVERKHVL